VATAQSVGSA